MGFDTSPLVIPAVASDPAGLLEIDADDRIVEANLTARRWLKMEPNQVVGSPLQWILREPARAEQESERLPDSFDLHSSDGLVRAVLVAFGPTAMDGHRSVVLFDAERQMEFAREIQNRHTQVERTQQRLELVINASLAFADATTETGLADILSQTTSRAYAAEESGVFLFDDSFALRLVAGSNPLRELCASSDLPKQAAGLREVLTISGIDVAGATHPALAEAFRTARVQSMLVAPIHLGDELIGILAVFFHHRREFDEQAAPLAESLTGQAAPAMSGLRLQRRLSHAAMHDETTGLPNRRVFENSLEVLLKARESHLAILFVDLDGFKNVNDRLGHAVGDEILCAVAERLQGTVREGDIVTRYGGDEFVVVCQVPNEVAALDLAERVRAAVGSTYSILPAGITIGASVGVSVTPLERAPEALDRLVRSADQAMYRAKNAGGNRVASG